MHLIGQADQQKLTMGDLMILVWYSCGYKRQREFKGFSYDQVACIARGLLPQSAIWRIEPM